MRHFGTFEAKTHFSELLGEVINGGKIVITRYGKEVAMIIPFTPDEKAHLAKEAIRTLKTLRKGITLRKGLSIREMRDEGRL